MTPGIQTDAGEEVESSEYLARNTWGDRVLLGALAATLVNVGMIWFLQLNHYPLYETVGRDFFQAYIAAHDHRLLLPVVLPGAAAAVLTIALTAVRPAGVTRRCAWFLCAVIAVIFASTILIQGPAHLALERDGYSAPIIARIVTSNWIRTIGWTVNAMVLLLLVAQRIRPRPAQGG